MNAKERFVQTRKAIKRLNEVKLLIMNGCDDWQPVSVRSRHETSDPTANRAIYNVDVLGEKLIALRDEEEELTEFIGTSLAIIEAVRANLGEEYALMLDARYIDCLSWDGIKHDYGYSKSTGNYLLNICFDWVDSVGVSRLLEGDTEL